MKRTLLLFAVGALGACGTESSDPATRPEPLRSAEMASTRGGVVTTFNFPTQASSWDRDNMPVLATTEAFDDYQSTQVEVGFFHGTSYKMQTQYVTLPSTTYKASWAGRVPLRPGVNTPVYSAYFDGSNWIFADQTPNQRVHPNVKYRKVYFHNTRTTGAAVGTETQLTAARAHDLVDSDDFSQVVTSNIDSIYAQCSVSTRNQFGNITNATNYVENGAALMPVSQFPASCRDVTLQGNYTNWDANCQPLFEARANALDPGQNYLHVFVLPKLRTPTICGFVRKVNQENILFMKESTIVSSSSATCFAHETGHTLGLCHADSTGCAEQGNCGTTGTRNLMCATVGQGLTSAQCTKTSNSTAYADYN